MSCLNSSGEWCLDGGVYVGGLTIWEESVWSASCPGPDHLLDKLEIRHTAAFARIVCLPPELAARASSPRYAQLDT